MAIISNKVPVNLNQAFASGGLVSGTKIPPIQNKVNPVATPQPTIAKPQPVNINQAMSSGGLISSAPKPPVSVPPVSIPTPPPPIPQPAPIPTYNPPTPQPAPAPVSPAPTAPAQPTPTYGGLIGSLAQLGQQDSPEVLAERKRLEDLRNSYANRTAGLERSGAGMSVIGGEEGIMNRQQAAQEGVISQNLASAIATQQTRGGFLGTAAGLTKPITGVPYGTQTIDPITGLPMGSGGGDMNPANAIPSLADQVMNGQMSIDQANSALGGNIGLTTALRNQIIQKNPNFNFIQSNAQAQAQATSIGQTGALGGQLTKQADTVKAHMTTLQNAYNQLGTNYGFPLINKGINAIKEQFGNGPLQAYDIALQNVRDELAKILGGGMATEGSRATAKSLLPDNMTPAQLQSSIQTATELMNSKIEEYTKIPTFGGNQQEQAGGSQGNISAGGFNFKQDAQGNWVPA